jgi:molybdopterin converting factor small subunit
MTNTETAEIEVSIQFESQLRALAPCNPLTLSCRTGSSILEVLQNIEQDAAVRDRLFTADGQFTASVLVFHNNQPVPHDQLVSTDVQQGDAILLFPPISGG